MSRFYPVPERSYSSPIYEDDRKRHRERNHKRSHSEYSHHEDLPVYHSDRPYYGYESSYNPTAEPIYHSHHPVYHSEEHINFMPANHTTPVHMSNTRPMYDTIVVTERVPVVHWEEMEVERYIVPPNNHFENTIGNGHASIGNGIRGRHSHIGY